ncbi:sulfotransferase 1C4 [Elysia marginata]|uniref:Sulfotransferase 1C4 n=1 Tax=Elysia marginata TaxID=1093978 RepID=A0AAV4FPQ4_9GAST|nr:sulfotransferase 1C4 [Elysia marginata]
MSVQDSADANKHNANDDSSHHLINEEKTDDIKENLSKEKVSNPFFFPERFLDIGLRLHDVAVAKFPVSHDPLTHLENIMALPMRQDDVVIVAFPKCGTHWVSDMLYMLTRGSVQYMEKSKECEMFEYVNDLFSLEERPSPRILNTHLYMRVLPREIIKKKIKIVHLVRNPKDVAVSYFHHLKQYASHEFTFHRFLQGYMMDHYMSSSHQINYVKQMAEFCSAHPEHPIITVSYEELKQDAVAVVRDLAQFLDVTANEKLFQEIVSACSFEKLKSKDETRSFPQNLQGTAPDQKRINLYRKGEHSILLLE